MKSLQICFAAALITLLGAGCSSSSNKASSPSPQDSCNALCTAIANCDAGTAVMTVDDCNAECAQLPSAPAACQTSAQAFFECKTAGDACTDTCTDQNAKMTADCG